MSLIRTVGLAALLVSSVACDKTSVDTSDDSPPEVEVQVFENNEWKTMSEVDHPRVPFDISGVVVDPEGVRSVRLEYAVGLAECITNSGSTSFKPVYPVSPKPTPSEVDLDPDEEGKVLKRWALVDTVPSDFTCTVGGQKGTPHDFFITVTATGRNWSDNPAMSTSTAKLEIFVD